MRSQAGKHVVASDAHDRVEFVLGGYLADQDQLDAVLLAVGHVDKKFSEVARPLGRAQRGAQGVDVLLLLCSVDHVEDEAGVTAIAAVLAPEQGGRLVEERRLHGREPLQHAIDLSVDVGLAQAADSTRGEFLFVPPPLMWKKRPSSSRLMYLANGGCRLIGVPRRECRRFRYALPDQSQSRANCSKAPRLSSLCGVKVRTRRLRLNLSPESR